MTLFKGEDRTSWLFSDLIQTQRTRILSLTCCAPTPPHPRPLRSLPKAAKVNRVPNWRYKQLAECMYLPAPINDTV